MILFFSQSEISKYQVKSAYLVHVLKFHLPLHMYQYFINNMHMRLKKKHLEIELIRVYIVLYKLSTSTLLQISVI